MPITTLTEFHHWLLAEEESGAPYILLHSEGGPLGCAAAVARQLNEFDEESGGNWIALSSEVVHAIAADPAQRRLLGVPDACPNCPPTSRCGIKKVLQAIARRGHVVFDDPLAADAESDQSRCFRAALGVPSEPENYHIILNPERFHARCLAPLIADSFLEWTTNRRHQSAA
ncbi:MAG: hypothetical protein AAGI48_02840 [Verrucomicrobiota bacterium]